MSSVVECCLTISPRLLYNNIHITTKHHCQLEINNGVASAATGNGVVVVLINFCARCSLDR